MKMLLRKRASMNILPHGLQIRANGGKILATSVFVTVAPGIWADYVFEKDYKLMRLNELEKYMRENKHLPGVNTAKDIETNGLDIGLTQAKLLEKLEESYLYILELNKRIESLEKKVN